MTTEHTPGPWFCATGCSWRRFLTVNGEEDVCVPTASRHDGHPDLIVSEADARLIAAAPDLLAALKALCDEGMVPAYGPHWRWSDEYYGLFENARAAINRAESKP